MFFLTLYSLFVAFVVCRLTFKKKQLWGDWEMEMNELLEECRVCRGAAMLVNELEAREMPLGIATSSGGEVRSWECASQILVYRVYWYIGYSGTR